MATLVKKERDKKRPRATCWVLVLWAQDLWRTAARVVSTYTKKVAPLDEALYDGFRSAETIAFEC